MPDEKQTILVACGLARRPRRKELAALVSPQFARTFHGEVVVHDVEDEGLVELGAADGVPLRAAQALVETDAVVTVTAAESVLHGGPAALLAAGGAEALRAANADSLLQTSGSSGWQLALAMERAVAARVPVIGLSLTLDQVRVAETAYGYPYDPASLERIVRSPFTQLFRRLPGPVRMRALRSLPVALGASAAFAGRPSVAHAEALLRAVELRSAHLDRPLDAICMGIPRSTPHLPRERPNPLLATYLGLGLALRMWRDEPPVAPGGTAILVHRFHRHFAHPTQQPYRAFFAATRLGPRPGGDRDGRALGARGRACARCLPRRPRVPSAAAVRGLGRLPATARPARRRADRRLPRCHVRPPARLRPHARCRRGAPDGDRRRRRAAAYRLPARSALLPRPRRLSSAWRCSDQCQAGARQVPGTGKALDRRTRPGRTGAGQDSPR